MSFLNKINTKQLRLLQVLPHLNSGGMVSGAIEISNFLKKNGATSIIVSSGGYRENEVLRNNANLIYLPVETKNPFFIYRNKNSLIKVIKKFNVNVIHARSRAPAWSSYWASKFTNTPFITTFHGTYGTESLLKKKYNSVMLKGDIVIAISRFIKDHIHKKMDIDDVIEKISVKTRQYAKRQTTLSRGNMRDWNTLKSNRQKWFLKKI